MENLITFSDFSGAWSCLQMEFNKKRKRKQKVGILKARRIAAAQVVGCRLKYRLTRAGTMTQCFGISDWDKATAVQVGYGLPCYLPSLCCCWRFNKLEK
jgi:hypothetical protein